MRKKTAQLVTYFVLLIIMEVFLVNTKKNKMNLNNIHNIRINEQLCLEIIQLNPNCDQDRYVLTQE